MFCRTLLSTRLGTVVPQFRYQFLLPDHHRFAHSQRARIKPAATMVETGAATASTPVRSDPIVTRLATAEFRAIFNDSLHDMIDIFKRNNYELRIAGGAVRDLLLHKTPTDLDFATSATPQQMKGMFEAAGVRMVNTNGEKHGTVTPRFGDAQFEVTTLRIDVATNGRHAEVEFTTDWQLDASRRDLTINSMFCDLEGNVFDYCFGYDDLLKRHVRFVGDPAQRIREDYLRILRYFRFYGRMADTAAAHDEPTVRAIAENIEGLARVSGERVWGELKKILEGRFASELVLKLVECGAAPHIGLPQTPNCEQFRRVCLANAEFAAQQAPMIPITMLSALLDTEEQAFQLHQRLKLSSFSRDLAKFLAVNATATRDVLDLLYYQKECFNTLGSAELQKLMILELLKFNGHRELVAQLLAWPIPVYPLSGQLLRANGCPGGIEMGLVQRKLRDQWKDSQFELTLEQLLERLPAAIAEVHKETPQQPPPQRHKQKKQKKQ